MQIRDDSLTHRVDGRIIVFDSAGNDELRSEMVPARYQATHTMSAPVGVAGAAVRMAREPGARVRGSELECEHATPPRNGTMVAKAQISKFWKSFNLLPQPTLRTDARL